jgi:hypothetical protein
VFIIKKSVYSKIKIWRDTNMNSFIKYAIFAIISTALLACGDSKAPAPKTEAQLKADSLLNATRNKEVKVGARRQIGGMHIHGGDLAKQAHQDPKKKARLLRNLAMSRDARKRAYQVADSLRRERVRSNSKKEYF